LDTLLGYHVWDSALVCAVRTNAYSLTQGTLP
jgi:hypothetical protein